MLLAGRSTALAPGLRLQMLPLTQGRLDTAHLSGDWQCWSAGCVTVALGNCQQPKAFPRHAVWTMWGELLGTAGYPGCRLGNRGAAPEALDSTTAQKGVRTEHHVFVSRAIHPPRSEKCRRMRSLHGVWSLQPSPSGFQLAFQLQLRAGYLGAVLLFFFHPDTYPCASQPLELQPAWSQAGGRSLATLECSAVITSLPRNFWGQRT